MASRHAESALLELRRREEAAALLAVQLEGLQEQVGKGDRVMGCKDNLVSAPRLASQDENGGGEAGLHKVQLKEGAQQWLYSRGC